MITELWIEPLFRYDAEFMTAGLVIHPLIENGHSLQHEDLNQLIAEAGITFGLEADAIEEAKEILRDGQQHFHTIVIARGRPVGISRDAYLQFAFEIGPLAGKILDNGSIDWRERRVMVPIEANQLIATKIPPVQGPPGINVFGQETPAREGKDLKVQIQNDVKYSKETMQVTSSRAGVLSVVTGNTIRVCSHQVIERDIDFETGNVESLNCITIRASVQPGFKVKANGDIKITGSVMSATIETEGNLVIQGGITGKNSKLIASGDADINFIEQGHLTCGGIVVVRKQAYYSIIKAIGSIRCQPGSIIMGGQVISEESITTGNIGSEESQPALIAAGVISERLQQFADLKKSVIDQQEAIIQWLESYPGSGNSKKVRSMEKELEATKLRLLRFNVIPGSGIYSRVGKPEDDPSATGNDYSNADAIDIGRISIDVHGTVYAGTKIQIGNCDLLLEKTISSRKFKLDDQKRRILAVPLKRGAR
jgi:uncharacterized protein (DUF342 family)